MISRGSREACPFKFLPTNHRGVFTTPYPFIGQMETLAPPFLPPLSREPIGRINGSASTTVLSIGRANCQSREGGPSRTGLFKKRTKAARSLCRPPFCAKQGGIHVPRATSPLLPQPPLDCSYVSGSVPESRWRRRLSPAWRRRWPRRPS